MKLRKIQKYHIPLSSTFPGKMTEPHKLCRIGIIGAGHLGRAIAETLIASGFPQDRIMLSHAGNPETLEALREAGLEPNLVDNKTICKRASVIFITVPPGAFASLHSLPLPCEGLIVSSIAGIPRAVLRKLFGVEVVRMMPSGPDTIRRHKGIAAIFPGNELLEDLLRWTGMQVHILPDEETMHVFTAGVCLPAAILASRAAGDDPDEEIADAIHKYPLLSPIYAWAKDVLPESLSGSGSEAYITEMSTPGGITEEVVSKVKEGNTISVAIEAGIARSRKIGGK